MTTDELIRALRGLALNVNRPLLTEAADRLEELDELVEELNESVEELDELVEELTSE